MILKLDNWSVKCAATANKVAQILHVTENQGAEWGILSMEKVNLLLLSVILS